MIDAKECRGEIIVINGNITPKKKPDLRIMDEGVSIYEVLRVKEKIPLFIEEHIDRFFFSSKITGIKNLPSRELIKEIFNMLIKNNPDIKEGNIKLLLNFPKNNRLKPDLYCYYIPHYYPSEDEYASGVTAVLLKSERRHVHSKVVDKKFRSVITQKINNENAYEVLLVNREGFITEGSKSNFFMIQEDRIVTPPEKDVLRGITRKYILRICKEYGLNLEEGKIHHKEINKYESCFITGTSPGVLAIKNIGHVPFNRENKLLEIVSAKYQSLVDKYIKINKLKLNNN